MRARLQTEVLPRRGLHILSFDMNIVVEVITLSVIYMAEDIKFLGRFGVYVCQFEVRRCPIQTMLSAFPWEP